MILSKKKEFFELAKMYCRKSGITADNMSFIVPIPDFKACLRAFGINLSPIELQRFVKKIPAAAQGGYEDT